MLTRTKERKQQLTIPHMRPELCTLNLGITTVFLFWICAGCVASNAQDAKQSEQLRRGELQEQVVREIDDLHTGDRWLLMRDAGSGGGPGRMVLAGKASQETTGGSKNRTQERPLPKTVSAKRMMNPSVIHIGDPVIVEENSPNMQARFEGLALGNASLGAFLNVRLAIGNKVVRVRAIDRGKAALAAREESWR